MKLNIKNILVITLIFLQLLPNISIYAVELNITQARETIANFAIDFYEKNPNLIYYLCEGNYEETREGAYSAKKKYKFDNSFQKVEDPNGVMYMDCLGWVNCCIHWSIGLDYRTI